MRAHDKLAERQRLRDAAHQGVPWKKWGPYLSDISGEDGIAGWCDDKMLRCFALGLWARQRDIHAPGANP